MYRTADSSCLCRREKQHRTVWTDDIVVLQKPLDNIYLAATSAMSLFSSLDALDNIKFSSLQESGWYVEAAKQAMEDGDIVFAGKYSEPDYELLVNSGL